MSSSSVSTKMSFKGLDSRKSHSWWWDSHIGPRNSKWLAENLEEMDQKYKQMLTLIEGEGDSFAKKAEMYYQRRPELVSHVEEFCRMYKLLAERYEHLTGEVRKNVLPDLQSQVFVGLPPEEGSFTTTVSPSPDPKMSRRSQSGIRAAGFDFFLGSRRSGLDRHAKGDETTSSISDSETESDVSSLHSYPGISEGTQARTMEAELESRDEQQETHNGSSSFRSENFDDVHSKIVDYEEELKMAREKIRLSEEEIANLTMELQKYTSASSLSLELPVDNADGIVAIELQEESNIEMEEEDISNPEQKVRKLMQESRIAKGRIQALDKEVIRLKRENTESSDKNRKLQDLLKLAQKEGATWKGKLEAEKRQASRLQERIARYKASLTDRENEVRDLKEVISDANRKYQLHAEISRLVDEKTRLEEKLREWEVHCHSLETQHGALETKLNDEIEHLKADIAERTHSFEALKSEIERLMSEKDVLNAEISARNDQIVQMEKRLQQLVSENEGTSKAVVELREEVERQKVSILEGAEGKREAIRQLCFSLDHYRNGYQQIRQAFMGHKQQFHVFAS